VTSAGMYGRIYAISDKVVTLEIGQRRSRQGAPRQHLRQMESRSRARAGNASSAAKI